MLSFLPKHIQYYLNDYNLDEITEIRLRTGYSVKAKINNQIKEIGFGKCICSKDDIETTLKNVTENSLYAFNENIKKGFLTTKKGVRLGLAGECVYDNGNIITIKNITSINVRVPHLIVDCAKEIFQLIKDEIKSVLIISPPFYGKTTMLKDLAIKLDQTKKYNILVVDERNEFTKICGGHIDSIKYCAKEYAFSNGIRSMSPDIIITDELMGDGDWKSVKTAICSGVKVIASCHSDDINSLKSKDGFISGLFERYVVLDSKKGQVGKISSIFNGAFNRI